MEELETVINDVPEQQDPVLDRAVEEPVKEAVEETANDCNAEETEVTEIGDNSEFDPLCSVIEQEKAHAEYREFCDLFPDLTLTELPDSIIESVAGGVPFLAACALYEYRRAAAEKAAAEINEQNRDFSFAVRQNSVQNGMFTREDVMDMTPSQVRGNYKRIIESMKNWKSSIYE